MLPRELHRGDFVIKLIQCSTLAGLPHSVHIERFTRGHEAVIYVEDGAVVQCVSSVLFRTKSKDMFIFRSHVQFTVIAEMTDRTKDRQIWPKVQEVRRSTSERLSS